MCVCNKKKGAYIVFKCIKNAFGDLVLSHTMNIFQHTLFRSPYKFSYGSMTHWSEEYDFSIQSWPLCKSLFTYPFTDTVELWNINFCIHTRCRSSFYTTLRKFQAVGEKIFKWRPRNGLNFMTNMCHWPHAHHKPIWVSMLALKLSQPKRSAHS